jgi:cytochrome c biogenesis protein CcdA
LSSSEIPLVMGAGAITLLSPCGYALIPAYIGYSATRGISLGRALIRSALASSGIILVYALMAGLIFLARETVRASIPHLALLAGLIITTMGVLKISTQALPTIAPVKNFTPTGEASFLLFGVAYGLGASGCNLPIFISVLIYATLASAGGPLVIMLAYALGVIAPLIIVGALASLLGLTIVKRLGGISHHLHRIGGMVLIAAGIYLLYFYITTYLLHI